jgi:hypothetical protein
MAGDMGLPAVDLEPKTRGVGLSKWTLLLAAKKQRLIQKEV